MMDQARLSARLEAFETSDAFYVDSGQATDAWQAPVIALRERPAEWLSEVCDAIDRLRSLSENWDSYGAAAPESLSIQSAVGLVDGLAGIVSVEMPLVTATPDGDVGFCWDTGDWSLDATIDSSGLVSYVFLHEAKGQEVESRTRNVLELARFLTGW